MASRYTTIRAVSPSLLLLVFSFVYLDRGHLKLMEKVENAVKQEKGLFIGGNFRSGVAFGDCVQYGADVAKELTSFVKSE